LLNDIHDSNTSFVVNVGGVVAYIVTLIRLIQSSKVSPSIRVIPEPIVIWVRELQSANVPLPIISVTLSGIVKLVIPVR
jgi:hypothetical protein